MGTYRREGDSYDQDFVSDGVLYRVDNRKPNHFTHDSLGDPFDCTEDHNHPEYVDDRPEWSDLSRSEKNLAFSFLAVVGGTVLLAGYGFAALIHRLLF
jgi:hypothetical protein